ncbi:hypothetical protein VZT92_017122 [Zoarces viviparus]|uniref:Uncharacterized protein n=1 Tax=Zoarces viviparus TaxID=48416 RepID=A0AAW1ETX6_ZOAVI
MNHNEGHRSRQPTLPSFSSRTLHHPSFMPIYMAPGFAGHRTDCSVQKILPISPAEFFYTDPMSCERVPNIVTDLPVFDCFQLNTPPPVMSAVPAPPSRPDPFRSEPPHPTRDLGSLTLKANTPHLPAQQPCRVIAELTQDEEQAITNLLKLHYQEGPSQSDEHVYFPSVALNPASFHHPELMDTTSADKVFRPLCSDVPYVREARLQSQLQQRSCWSDTELEVANTLLSGFSLMGEDKMWGQNHNESSSLSSDSKTTECTLSDSEAEAARVLLSLKGTRVLDIKQ